jgi:hypothetical protein
MAHVSRGDRVENSYHGADGHIGGSGDDNVNWGATGGSMVIMASVLAKLAQMGVVIT